MRVARWSIWNKLPSRSGSCSPCSSSSISLICRSTRDWLRRDRFTNIALTLPRSAASLAASRSASRCTWSKARATSPISSKESTSIGSTSAGACSLSDSLIRRTVSGSRTPATSSAPARSRRSGRTMDRPTTTVNSSEMISTSSTAAPIRIASMIACLRRCWAREMACWASACSTTRILMRVSRTLPNHSSGLSPMFDSEVWVGAYWMTELSEALTRSLSELASRATLYWLCC